MTKTKGTDNTETLGLSVVCINCHFPQRGLCLGPLTTCCGRRQSVRAYGGAAPEERITERQGLLSKGPRGGVSLPFSGDTVSYLGQGIEIQDHNLWVLSDRNGTSSSVSHEQPPIGPPGGGWASSPDIHTASRYTKETVRSKLVVEKSRKLKH